MKWVEILGPSGVGKSFFLNSLKSIRNDESNWLSIEEAKLKWAFKNSEKGLISQLIKFYLKQSIIKSKKNILAESLIDSKKAYLQEGDKFEQYLNTYFNHFVNIELSAQEKVYRISLFHTIIENLCLQSYYNMSNPILLDEGPVSHHPSLKMMNWETEKLLPMGLIFCHLTVEKNLDRIFKRKKEGRLAPLHQGMDDHELLEHVQEKHRNYLEKRDLLVTLNIPYLDVDLEKMEKKDLIKTQNFIMNVNKKNDSSY